tara:strand:- start:37 stop:390 length:354 start_codon:yes stop_codon:yes gene_type:complete
MNQDLEFDYMTPAKWDSVPDDPKTEPLFFDVADAAGLIRASQGRIFGVTFIKRTDGELRTMSARLGVKSYLKGGTLNYDPSAKKLLIVFDMKAQGYRAIPLDSIMRIRLDTIGDITP